MTLTELLEAMRLADPDAPLTFATPEGDIGAGFHVTEFKQAEVRSIDCGGAQDGWQEARMQLMAGPGKAMPVSRFRKIAEQSGAALYGLAQAPLIVEFSPKNKGLRQYRIRDVEAGETAARVLLEEDQVMCKAMAPRAGQAVRCCA